MSLESELGQKNSSSNLLVALGILWLLLATALLIYQLANPRTVEIKWETATEQQTAGFNLYRSKNPDEAYELVNKDHFINSLGGPVTGAEYSYIDTDVTAGETYFYVLEEVEFDSSKNRYENEIFEYTVPGVTWWAIVLTAGSVIIGLILLLSGLKEARSL